MNLGADMGRGQLLDYVILGGLMLLSFAIGAKVKRDKSFFAYLVVMVLMLFVTMAIANALVSASRPWSFIGRFGRNPGQLGLLLWAPYFAAGFLAWLMKPGRRSASAPPPLTRQFTQGPPSREPSLTSQTARRVIVTVAAAVISYAILSMMGLAETPSIITSIGIALFAIIFG